MRIPFPARRLTFLLGAFFSLSPVLAADLLQVYREALANDPQYQAARATAEAGREKLPQGVAGLLPVISGTANTTGNRNSYDYKTTPEQIFDHPQQERTRQFLARYHES